MKLKFSYLLCMILLISCSKYDDSAVKDDIRNLQDRVTKLETLCNVTNTNLSSLQTIVDALQQQITILQVEPLTNGYKIYFSDGNVATIQNGKNSDDVPEIGVQQDSDGIYYWTLDGVWLEDKQGNRIKAQGTDGTNGESAYELAVEKGYNGTLEEWLASLKGINGTNGKSAYELAVEKGYNGTLDEWLTSLKGTDGDDAITPQLKIENDYWYLSYDNGETWTLLGKATGEDGKDGTSCIFKSVTEDTNNVYFQLTNNTQIIIPKGENSKFAITFDNTDIAILNAGGTTTVSYTITNATDATIVKTISQDGWKATVQPISTSAGTITITAPDPITESEILVFANDGSYRTAMASLNCTKGQILIADNSFNVDVNGGIQDVHILTNINYTIDIPNDAKSWISVIETRAMREETISFQIEPNEGTPRFATIVLRDNLQQPVQTIIFNQTSNNEIEIPDAAFKQYLLENFDTNKDGILSQAEADKVTEIYIQSYDVKSLQGIEYFTGLKTLSCSNCSISNLDVSKNIVLEGLYCSYNPIKELNVNNLANLKELYCDGCLLSNLSLDGCPALERLSCLNNQLSNINISKNTMLKALYCSDNHLSSLDVSKNILLNELSCYRCQLKELDVSTLPNLTSLMCGENELDVINVSNNPKLELLWCDINNLAELDVSNNPKLYSLSCGNAINPDGSVLEGNNHISAIDISNNPELTTLFLSANKLTHLDVTRNLKLRQLDVNSNDIHSINLSNNIALEELFCAANDLTYLDVTKNENLKQLGCSINSIENIDLSHNHNLEHLSCFSNKLSVLDISYSPNIKALDCTNNPNLTEIYVNSTQNFTYYKDDIAKFIYKDGGEPIKPSYYESTDYSQNGKVTVLQTATKGNGIDIVLMGDGYSDRLIADGTYDRVMNTAMESFFTEEPYKSFRELFNVYSVKAVSTNEVYANSSSTAFSGYFGGGTHVGGNDQQVFAFAQKAIDANRIEDALIVVMMNSTTYAGTCYIYSPSSGDYGNGASISYFPVGEDETALAQVLHHEAGGHGFSKLGDEYGSMFMESIPENEVENIKNLAEYGWLKNIDITDDVANVKWNHFLTDTRYANEGLGIYEGAYTYGKGVYRPSWNSIMRDNTGGFNAPSREAIYYRIHKLAYGESWTYDYEQFVTWDAINRNVTTKAYAPWGYPEDFEPLAPPVINHKSWRNAHNTTPLKKNTNITDTHNSPKAPSSSSNNNMNFLPRHIPVGSMGNMANSYMEFRAKK